MSWASRLAKINDVITCNRWNQKYSSVSLHDLTIYFFSFVSSFAMFFRINNNIVYNINNIIIRFFITNLLNLNFLFALHQFCLLLLLLLRSRWYSSLLHLVLIFYLVWCKVLFVMLFHCKAPWAQFLFKATTALYK